MLKYLKKFVFLFFCFFVLLPSIAGAQVNNKSSNQIINLYFFYGDGCSWCAKEEKFLAQLKIENLNVKVHYFEIWYNQKNAQLLEDIIRGFKLDVQGPPLLFIGNDAINGYLNDETTGEEIKQLVEYHQAAGTADIFGKVIYGESDSNNIEDAKGDIIIYGGQITTNRPKIITLPLFGQINPQKLSLFTFTAVIGLLDGFNPCAMWVLLFLISMLMHMQNRRRMWAIGLTFIGASGLVYFMFLAAWLNVFLFIGFIFWIRLLVALVAVGSGVYHLREFYVNRKGACKVAKEEKRTRMFNQIKAIIAEKNFALALIGIVGLAAAVNMVELVCSAGLPAIYTSILSSAKLLPWQYYGYLLLYMIFFVLDDMAIFVIAMVTLRVTGVTKKYVRAANLIGGIILLLIGILLIFKPGWILFG